MLRNPIHKKIKDLKIFLCHRGLALAGFIATFFAVNSAYACSVCFGATKDQFAKRGIVLAVVTMLVILAGIMGGVIAFFINIHKRTKLTLK